LQGNLFFNSHRNISPTVRIAVLETNTRVLKYLNHYNSELHNIIEQTGKREKGIHLQDTYNFPHMYQVLIRFLRDEQPVFRYDLLRYQDENVAKEKEELISNLKKHGITKKMITRLAWLSDECVHIASLHSNELFYKWEKQLNENCKGKKFVCIGDSFSNMETKEPFLDGECRFCRRTHSCVLRYLFCAAIDQLNLMCLHHQVF
jgi:hypothetical protein